jgi:hypothetical protein
MTKRNRSRVSTTQPARREQAVRSDRDGLGAVLMALEKRQFDLWAVTDREWQAMSTRQQRDLITAQNTRERAKHWLGSQYVSDVLREASRHAHDRYLQMTPAQRQRVLHPRHLDEWLADRRLLTIVAKDVQQDGEPPSYLLPKTYEIPDDGPQPSWRRAVGLTVTLNLDAPVQRLTDAVNDLVTSLHAPAARRPRHDSTVRPTREKYEDEDVAAMIRWYYELAAGASLKQLAIQVAGPKARHVAAMQTKMLRQLRWFRQELGISIA